MDWQFTPFVIPLFTATAVSIVAMVLAWRRRSARGATPLTVLLFLGGWWTFGNGMLLLSAEQANQSFWSQFQWLAIAFVPAVFLSFALEYTGRYVLNARFIRLLMIEPLFILAAQFTNSYHEGFWTNIRLGEIGGLTTRVTDNGPLYWVNAFYAYILLVYSLYLVYQKYRASSAVYRAQSRILLFAFTIPFISNVITVFKLNPFEPIDLTPFAFVFCSLGALWAMFGLRFLDVVPVARDAVVESMADAIIVLDERYRILDVNPAACQLFKISLEVIGLPGAEALPLWTTVSRNNRRLIAGSMEIDYEQRNFDVRISPIQDRAQRLIGHLLIFHDITERKKTESELSSREKMQASILEFSPDPIVLYNIKGEATYVNSSFVKTFGWEREELLGKRIDFVPEDQRQVTIEGLKRLLAEGYVNIFDTKRFTKDGRMLDIQLSASVLRDAAGNPTGSIVSLRDIGDRKQIEEALRESETKYRTIIETIQDGYYEVDLKGHFYFFNDAMPAMLGRTPEEVQGIHYKRLMNEENAQRVFNSFNRVYRTGDPEKVAEYQVLQPNGIPRYVETSVTLIRNASGEPTGFRGIMRDVTARMEAQEELARAKNAAESANRSKSTFLANMSHELRTPLNAILGYTDLLLSGIYGTVTEKQVDRLKRVIENGHHLLGLINDVLDLSKIEAGKMEVYIETFSVPELLETVISSVRPLAEKKQNNIQVEVAPELGNMHSDLTKVRQILYNLLSNAAKFTEKGTITLRVSVDEMAEGDWFNFQVQDTGIGMSAEQVSIIFDEFSQADGSTTRKYGGTGLGLSISRRFCWMLGGDITVESEEGMGSTFTVQLPREAVLIPEDTPPPMAIPVAAHGTDGNTILVIDDDNTIRDLMEHYLKNEGFRVITAADGQTGLQLAQQMRPSVITLDVMMAGMDGWSVLSQLKATPELAHIPVIMLTMIDDKNTGYALGASDYLTKPIDRRHIVKILMKYHCVQPPCPVLIVEDDASTRAMLRDALEGAGWVVAEAENGRVGLEKMQENRPALILLDLMMPEMDGFGFVEAVRQYPEWRQIPIVVITARDLTHEDRLKLNGYVQRILQKGAYNRENLLREVREIIKVFIG